ncbi:tetratricopeptide repeat protein 1 [Lampris incognitus]|uniref:tetratricopeptide repeat protein 1 n=1 Tax=Lampris incognitus TaxID=2546036 RepID=UPI0024B53DBF|nr:tetratricopeptide repeat protein 1 [Lampris incognitus]
MEPSGSGEVSGRTAQSGSPVEGRELGSAGEDVRGEQSEEHFYDCQEVLEPPLLSFGSSGPEERRGGGIGEDDESLLPHTQTDSQAESRPGGGGASGARPGGGGASGARPGGGGASSTQPGAGGASSTQPGGGGGASGAQVAPPATGAEGAEGADEESWGEATVEEADGGMDSDVEVKEEENTAPEFDDEYLREAEKDLSEEEKESRRLESLSLKERGNNQFKAGEHSEAEQSYTQALCVCPVCYSRERAVLFSNRAAARIHLDHKEPAIADCSRAIELNPDYMRAILRRAELYEKTDKLDEALEDYKTVLDKDPGNHTAREACMRLPQQIHERNEKLKEEMMSKLKDLGNLFLRPFGLSTNNFQVNQDTTTGSYSVNFVQNPNNNNR